MTNVDDRVDREGWTVIALGSHSPGNVEKKTGKALWWKWLGI